VSADTRAAIFFSDQTFRGRRWDSASHIQQAIFRGDSTLSCAVTASSSDRFGSQRVSFSRDSTNFPA